MAEHKLPLHPQFVHFPIALLGTSLIFDIIGLARGEPVWWSIAFWNIALGLVIAAVAATTGLMDSRRVKSDSPAAKVVTPHMLSMIAAVVAYGVALIIRGGPGTPSGAGIAGTIVLEAVGLLLLIVGGYLGGEMVYRHGVGQMRDDRPPASPRRHTPAQRDGRHIDLPPRGTQMRPYPNRPQHPESEPRPPSAD